MEFQTSDEGIVVRPPMAALAMGPDAALTLIAPRPEPGAGVPVHVLFMTALMMRTQSDPDFVQDVIDWARLNMG